MALRTLDYQCHPDDRRCIGSIDRILDQPFLFNIAVLMINDIVAIEPRANLLSQRWTGQITSQLFNRELIEWHVGVECFDDPVGP